MASSTSNAHAWAMRLAMRAARPSPLSRAVRPLTPVTWIRRRRWPTPGGERDGQDQASAALRWMPVRRARYYNVQFFRSAGKILSVPLARPHCQIKKRWAFLGTPQRLGRGRYRWSVGPGIGARAQADYGDLLARRTRTVVGP